MIPPFWLQTCVNVFATVVAAVITGGYPGMYVCDSGHLHYTINYLESNHETE